MMKIKTLAALTVFTFSTASISAPPSEKGNKTSDLSSVQVMSNGQPVGEFLQILSPAVRFYLALSSKGYFFEIVPTINVDAGKINTQRIYYEALDCSSAPYAIVDTTGRFSDSSANSQQGYVFRQPTTGQHLYVQSGSTPIMRRFVSTDNGHGCEMGVNGGDFLSVPVLDNDPDLTGVPNIKFQPPITLGYR